MKSSKDITCTSIIRSMSRAGFSQEEIYDVITGTGISGDDVQLVLDRVKSDFEKIEFKSRTSRLSREVENIIDVKLEEASIEFNSKIRILGGKISSMESSLDRLENRMIELQSICDV